MAQKYDLVFTVGTYIDKVDRGQSRFVLYKVFSFYVEIEYDIACNKIISLYCTDYLQFE